jgi:hypothetical protein
MDEAEIQQYSIEKYQIFPESKSSESVESCKYEVPDQYETRVWDYHSDGLYHKTYFEFKYYFYINLEKQKVIFNHVISR